MSEKGSPGTPSQKEIRKTLERLHKTKPPLEIRATRRFIRDYRRASLPLRVAARRKALDMQLQADARKTWMKAYKSMVGTRRSIPGQVIELKIGAGDRLLVHVKGGVATLTALGAHEITEEVLTQRNLKSELEKAVDPPEGFVRPSLLELLGIDFKLQRQDEDGRFQASLFGPEVQDEWLTALSDEQVDAWTEVVELADSVLDSGEAGVSVVFLEGGPGTGKTSVLLNLLDEFTQKGRRVGLHMADHLKDFICTQTTIDLGSAIAAAAETDDPVEIALVDDPESLDALRWGAARARVNARTLGRAVVVVAFDPLQVEGRRKDELTDGALQAIRSEHSVVRIVLRDCYRQRSNVGRAARNVTGVILDSSPYFKDEKKAGWARDREAIAKDALDLRFINEAGRVDVFEQATFEDWRDYLSYVAGTSLASRHEGDPGHWPALAVVEPMSAELPETWVPLMSSVPHHRISGHGWPDQLRGIEYQHVAVVLTESELTMVTDGFAGSGRTDYEKFRLLRIPFSRARESLAVFAVP